MLVLACPLCQSPKIRRIAQLTGNQLRALWKALGHVFSQEAWGKISADFAVQKLQCQSCRFIFFDPALAGNQAFYRELEHDEYFAEARPEFQRTLRFARGQGLGRVLDVGCGSGVFLDLARESGMETYGLELNETAWEKARCKGHQIFSELLPELDPERLGRFDLITLFQVLEHVAEPVEVMKSAARFLKPGGYISIAVPSEQGICRFSDCDPAQWPPHHVSRWRLQDLEQLARAAGLKLAESGADLLLGSDLEHVWTIRNRLAEFRGKKSRPQSPGWLKAGVLIYRKSGMKWVFPKWGLSIYGYFKAE